MMKHVSSIILFTSLCVSGFSQTPPSQRASLLPILKDGSAAAFVAFTQPKQTLGLAMMNPSGSGYQTKTVYGKRGVMPADDSKDNSLYFQAARDQLVTATGTFFVTVTYLDDGQGAITFEYNSLQADGNKELRNEIMFLNNSGDWQRYTFTLTGAVLDHSLEGDSDFRIQAPGIPIHAVMLTRFPVITRQPSANILFKQQGVSPPAGYEFGVMVKGSGASSLWEKEKVMDEKALLYNAWGVRYVIDTVNAGFVQTPQGSFDLSLYAERSRLLRERNLVWTPRFKIGDSNTLPMHIAETLQRAIGTDRPKAGPMLSIWDNRLVDYYAQFFSEFRRKFNPQHLPRIVLSFAGDWGPLYYSADASEREGWPDFWAGDGLALRSFRSYLEQRYGNSGALGNAWGTPISGWQAVFPTLAPEHSPQRMLDTFTWYRQSLTSLVQRITERAQRFFPQTKIQIEISDDFQFSAIDAVAIASVAAGQNASVLMMTRDDSPAASPYWQWLAYTCRLRHVTFGLHPVALKGREGVLSSLYSLASEGGTIYYFPEELLTGDKAWELYAQTVPRLRLTPPNPRVALVFPRTSMSIFSPVAFLRLVSDLRDAFGFDVVDEDLLDTLSSSEYPLIFVPWGTVWSSEALAAFERLVRSGSALVVHTDSPWMTPRGDMQINERLFAVQLVRGAEGWKLEPRKPKTNPFEQSNPITRVDHRVVELGTEGDDVFLEDQWGDPQNEQTARRFGFPFSSFRWMGERGRINLPMLPGKQYMLQLEGFLPPGKRVRLFINREYLGGITGKGYLRWSQPIRGKMRSKKGDINILLRGDLWSPGRVLGATQTRRVSMAVSKVSVFPLGEQPGQVQETAPALRQPEFRKEALRGSWLREVGQGITLIAPQEYVNEWVYKELLNAIVIEPSMLAPKYRFTLPPDGANNRVFVKPLRGSSSLYLNLNDVAVQAGSRNKNVRPRTLPPKGIYYQN